jgi:hypothetical protein
VVAGNKAENMQRADSSPRLKRLGSTSILAYTTSSTFHPIRLFSTQSCMKNKNVFDGLLFGEYAQSVPYRCFDGYYFTRLNGQPSFLPLTCALVWYLLDSSKKN